MTLHRDVENSFRNNYTQTQRKDIHVREMSRLLKRYLNKPFNKRRENEASPNAVFSTQLEIQVLDLALICVKVVKFWGDDNISANFFRYNKRMIKKYLRVFKHIWKAGMVLSFWRKSLLSTTKIK